MNVIISGYVSFVCSRCSKPHNIEAQALTYKEDTSPESEDDEYIRYISQVDKVCVSCSNEILISLDIWVIIGANLFSFNSPETRIPKRLGTASDWRALSTGEKHLLAKTGGGEVFGFGYQDFGQLGNGAIGGHSSFIQLDPSQQWQFVSAGGHHSHAIGTNGVLWSWGQNKYGELGRGGAGYKTELTGVNQTRQWQSVWSSRQSSTLLLDDSGLLWSSGYNEYGNLGLGHNHNVSTLSRIPVDTRFTTAALGFNHALAIDEAGNLYAWGQMAFGQGGIDQNNDQYYPKLVDESGQWQSITAGWIHSLGLKQDGSLWAWGKDHSGATGLGENAHAKIPTRVGNDNDWIKVVAGSVTSYAIKRNGSLWAWGGNNEYALGDGTNTDQFYPVQVGDDYDWTDVASSGLHVLAIKSNGTLWGWGRNHRFALQYSNTSYLKTPTRIGAANDWLAVFAGEGVSFGLKKDASLWSWGSNTYSMRAAGESENIGQFSRIGSDQTWRRLALSNYAAVGVDDQGQAWGWGANQWGQLGDGTAFCHEVLPNGLFPDSDGDRVPNIVDAFPNNAAESIDSDGDGVGNNADTDDDNDQLPDTWEREYGLDPLNALDSLEDLDGDGLSVFTEYTLGSNPLFIEEIETPTMPDSPAQTGDFTGDGRVDVMIRDPQFNLALHYGAGVEAVAGELIHAHYSIKAQHDLNGDGFADLLFRDELSGDWLYYLMRANQTLSTGVLQLNTGSDWLFVGMGRFSSDQRPASLLRNQQSGEWRAFVWNDQQVIESFSPAGLTANADWQVKALADFDGDGQDDILMRHQVSGGWYLYRIAEQQKVAGSGGMPMTSNRDWSFIGTADMDGDNKADVVLRHQTGAWFLYTFDGKYRKAGGDIGILSATTNRDWQAQQLADFTGDGMADLLLRHRSSGIWYLVAQQGLKRVPENTGVLSWLTRSQAWTAIQ